MKVESGFNSEDYKFISNRLWKIIRRLFLISFILKLLLKVKKTKPDIIVGEEPNRLNQQLIVSLFLKIPYIWHIHNENQFVNVNESFFKLVFKHYLKNVLMAVRRHVYCSSKT